MAFDSFNLLGNYQLFDGSAAEGVIEIIPSVKVVKDTTGNVILSGRVKVTLEPDVGSFSVSLPDPNDVTLSPSAFGYTVVAKLRHAHLKAVSFGADQVTGPTLDVEDITPVDVSTLTPTIQYPTSVEFATEVADRISGDDFTLASAAGDATEKADAAQAGATSAAAADATGKVAAEAVLRVSGDAATLAAAQAAIAAVIAGAPGALDTLNELAAQLGSDESAAGALTTLVSGIRDLSDSAHNVALSTAYVPSVGQSMQALPATDPTLTSTTVRPIDVVAGVLYGVDGTTIKKSTDTGVTWTTVQDLGGSSGVGEITAIRDAGSGEVLIARNSSGVYRSTGWAANPATATFAQVLTVSGGSAGVKAYGISTNPVTGVCLVAEYDSTYANSRYVKRSTDHGVTWTVVYDLWAVATDDANVHLHLAEVDPWANDRLWISWHHRTNAEPGGVFYSDDLGVTWTALTTVFQPTVGVATDRGMVFGSDEIAGGVYVAERTTVAANMVYRIAWEWREATNAIAGFAYRGFRDPATGVVYLGFIGAIAGMPKGLIAASDAVTASSVWRSDAITVDSADGARNVVVLNGKILAPIATNSATTTTWEQFAATLPRRGSRISPVDDPGRVLGGRATGSLSYAAGTGAVASGLKASAIGRQAVASGSQAYAAGYGAVANFNGSLAIGDTAVVGGSSSVSIGNSATSTGQDSTVVGVGATGVTSATSVGRLAIATNNSVVVGKSASATGSAATVVGKDATGAAGAIAVGSAASAGGANTVVIGTSATAAAASAVAIGWTTNADANAVAVGYNANATSQSTVVGKSASVSGANTAAVAVGYSATAALQATAVGWTATAAGTFGTALGYNASAGHSRAVALGSNTVTNGADQVMVGTRHIELVEVSSAPGGSTDAARVYAIDNGSGKTEFRVQFATGVVQPLAIQGGHRPIPDYTTALRPTGMTYKGSIFDTTLGKPVWWNGTGWVDATGTAA